MTEKKVNKKDETKEEIKEEVGEEIKEETGEVQAEKPDLVRITLKCAEAGGIVYAEGVSHDFECPHCSAPLHYQPRPMSLTTTSDIKHEVLRVVELNKK